MSAPNTFKRPSKTGVKRRHSLLGTPSRMLEQLDEHLLHADLVMCNGVLHHLDDHETRDVLKLAKAILANNGRFVCVEAVHLRHQSWFSTWTMNWDRGLHIRSEQDWKRLFQEVFPNCESHVTTHLLRIPTTTLSSNVVTLRGERFLLIDENETVAVLNSRD